MSRLKPKLTRAQFSSICTALIITVGSCHRASSTEQGIFRTLRHLGYSYAAATVQPIQTGRHLVKIKRALRWNYSGNIATQPCSLRLLCSQHGRDRGCGGDFGVAPDSIPNRQLSKRVCWGDPGRDRPFAKGLLVLYQTPGTGIHVFLHLREAAGPDMHTCARY